MVLEIKLLEYADIPAFAAVDSAAMASWGLAKAMQNGMPAGVPREEFIIQMTQQGYANDEKMAWLKVVDTELEGKMVAAALWRFQYEQEEAKMESSAPIAEVEGVEEMVKQVERPGVMAAMHEQSKPFTDKYVHGQPHAHLSVLVTHPLHQRRGAGTMLVQWGCAKADEKGLMQTLHSSPAGLRAYEKCGFQTVQTLEMDLRPWGVEEVEVRRFMIRGVRGETVEGV